MESNEYLYKADLRKSLTQLVFEADLAKKQTEELIKNGQAITQPELDETNARISEIIAHNGDGTKDTEVIDARKGQTTLRDKINLIDSDIEQIAKDLTSTRKELNLYADLGLTLHSGSYYISGPILKPSPDVNRARTEENITFEQEVSLRVKNENFLLMAYKMGEGSICESSIPYAMEIIAPAGAYRIVIKHKDNLNLTEVIPFLKVESKICEKNNPDNPNTEAYISEVKAKMLNNSSGYDLIMPCITDTHYFPTKDLKWGGSTTTQNIKHVDVLQDITRQIPCDGILHLGDISYDWTFMDNLKNYISETYTSLSRCNCESYFAFGNHDFGDSYCINSGEKPLSPAQLNFLVNKSVGKNGYYFIDFEQQKIRIIVLNSSDAYVLDDKGNLKYNRSEGDNKIGVRQEQTEWLANVALNTREDDWKLVIASHVAPDCRDQFINNKQVADILNCRKNKTSLTISNTNVNLDFDLELNLDFANYKNIDIICWVVGHEHNAFTRIYEGINIVGIPFIQGDNNGFNRPEGIDTTMTTLDFMCVDTINRRVDFVRYGKNGSDRTLNY